MIGSVFQKDLSGSRAGSGSVGNGIDVATSSRAVVVWVMVEAIGMERRGVQARNMSR